MPNTKIRFPLSFLLPLILVSAGFTAEPGPGQQGVIDPEPETILQIDFDSPDGSPLDLSGYQHAQGQGRNDTVAITAAVEKDRTTQRFRVPFEEQAGNRLTLTYWSRGEPGTQTAVWVVKDGKERQPVTFAEAHGHWHRTKASVTIATDKPGYLEVLAPNAYKGDPGRVWVDDLKLQKSEGSAFTLDHTQDFPALATDDRDRHYLALIARPLPDHQIRVYRFDGDERHRITTLQPEGMSRVGRPAIAPAEQGCFVAFAAYQDRRWRIAYAFVDEEGTTPIRYLDPGGHANVKPAVARMPGGHCIVWESNAELPRGIYAATVRRDESGDPARISKEHPGNNPTVTTTEDGRVFAAWDGIQNQEGDVYLSRINDRGRWEPPRRITDDPRIERHPSLATRDGELYLAWELRRFKKHRINNAIRQRVAVARIDGDQLSAPEGMIENVFGARWMTRPTIAFGPRGRLWLTARRSMGGQANWKPVVWSCSDGQWQGPRGLWHQQGRWRPVPMTFLDGRTVVAVQRDNLPKTWTQRGRHPAWDSDVILRAVEPETDSADSQSLSTMQLDLPDTDFRLVDHIQDFSLNLPRRTIRYQGSRLKGFWGDLHEHTAMSVCQRRLNPAAPDLFANQRDVQNLDFTAITDHGYNLDRPQWAYTRSQILAHHDPGHFVTLLGEEWTSSDVPPPNPDKSIGPDNFKRYGHRNIIFQNPQYPEFYDSYDGNIAPEEVWNQIGDSEFVMVPHQIADWTQEGHGNPPTDWRHHHEHHQPLAEIFQARGSYEAIDAPRAAQQGAPFEGNYLQDAWEKGIVIGVIASPDHGGGTGVAGVWAEELTREALFDAFHARHTWGTSGARISLLVKSDNHMMGDKVTSFSGDSVPLQIETVTGQKKIERIVILRNNDVVHTVQPGSTKAAVNWTDQNPPDKPRLWYYVRVERADGELAWSSPIWFLK